jgi:hypothetical protein
VAATNALPAAPVHACGARLLRGQRAVERVPLTSRVISSSLSWPPVCDGHRSPLWGFRLQYVCAPGMLCAIPWPLLVNIHELPAREPRLHQSSRSLPHTAGAQADTARELLALGGERPRVRLALGVPLGGIGKQPDALKARQQL